MKRNLKNLRDFHNIQFDQLQIKQGDYETRVESLLSKFLLLEDQLKWTEQERFARELHNLRTFRTN